METCKYEKEIAIMGEKMDRLIHAIEGNGKPGLLEEYRKFKMWVIVTILFIATGGATSGAMFFNLLKTMILGN